MHRFFGIATAATLASMSQLPHDLALTPAVLDDYLHDAERMAWLLATWESAKLIDREMHAAQVFKGPSPRARHDPVGRNALLRFAVDAAPREGLFCEFGVHKGETITHLAGHLAEHRPGTTIHGFDSFEGLPDDWFLGRKAGRFSLEGNAPLVPGNVALYKGWFDQTLPMFVPQHDAAAAFLHIDADLYSSTKTILDVFHAAKKIIAGTVIVFDEYFNYPGWQEHEYKAWREFVAAAGVKFEYLGMAPCHYSVAVRVTDVKW